MKTPQDIINTRLTNEFKENMNYLCVHYNQLLNKDAVKARESEQFEVYAKQHHTDLLNIIQLRIYAQNIVDEANKLCSDLAFNPFKTPGESIFTQDPAEYKGLTSADIIKQEEEDDF